MIVKVKGKRGERRGLIYIARSKGIGEDIKWLSEECSTYVTNVSLT